MQPPEALTLASGLERLGLALDADQQARLLAYQDLIAKWNRVYNLTAVRDPAEMLTHHLLDSLSVVLPLRRHAAGRPLRLLDVGSGAGLPGVVLAIAEPQWHISCVDTVGKKASFIQQAAAELGLRQLRSEHARVEEMPPAQADVVTSRAFASLSDFTRLTAKHLAPAGGTWMAMKGKPPTAEIAELPAILDVFHVEPLQVPDLDAERCLIWIRPRAAE
ncbi:16S rRNA (guanine(527)-N(7))-methyltransferase RsmG [Rhizobacter sp. OV335]|uniref:16S rRNA (guanine(527)-N(7))-methyltransferase RsmG n=1 Tax=Rhizobacter sp. OV335 TaxID=1500264 RepID=UPI000912BACB|nr:16S rRNA (guanine(527)-N(7))-methyltransferase RsmG [Rhizobacter sp. OV335]SHN28240.1 16S rRNA (guanine527-N7)-methyltransferase [Rhizobacter sp. OV335]